MGPQGLYFHCNTLPSEVRMAHFFTVFRSPLQCHLLRIACGTHTVTPLPSPSSLPCSISPSKSSPLNTSCVALRPPPEGTAREGRDWVCLVGRDLRYPEGTWLTADASRKGLRVGADLCVKKSAPASPPPPSSCLKIPKTVPPAWKGATSWYQGGGFNHLSIKHGFSISRVF